MTEAFLKVVNMSISAGCLVLAVLVLRFILKKAPKWVNVLLWGIVAIRLICPFSIESRWSLIPDFRLDKQDFVVAHQEASKGQILDAEGNVLVEHDLATEPQGYGQILDSEGNALIEKPLNLTTHPGSASSHTHILALIWIFGMILMLGYSIISYFHLRRRVATAFPIGKTIRQSEQVDTPFVLGLIRPVIYLPLDMESVDMEYVIAHELAHIRRKDHWWKPLGFALLAVHWFNPLMWVAYILLCRDIELACDEKVIVGLDNENRANYSQALVACSVNRRAIAACPLAFGEVGVKERVKSIMNYRKPGFWVIVLAVILCAILAVSMLTDPIPENTPAEIFGTLESGDVQWAQATIWNVPAGDHIMLSSEQINELVSILNSLEAQDYEKNRGAHGASVMINCGDREILLHVSFEEVYFSFDEETAEILGNTSWSIRSESLNEFLDGIVERHSLLGVTEWISFDTSDIDEAEATHPAFPGVVFRWTEAEITTDGETLIQGMPIWNTYFADLNGDDMPEICATVSFGSGMVDTHVVVYDYINGQEYTLWDRGIFDYSLSLENGVLLCRKFNYPSSPFVQTEALGSGRLMLTDAGGGEGKRLAIDQLDEKPGATVWIKEIVDRSVTEGLPTDEALEPFWEDESYIYSFPSIRSHLVVVTYNNGNSEDIKTALENGRVSIADLDKFGIKYYAEPKESVMQPTQTNLRGLVAGYLFTPINGATYRYAMTDAFPENVTADRLLDTFTEETNIEGIVWEVYSLKEYPDMTKLLMISGVGSAWLCEYAPAQRAEEGALEAARAAGFMIEEDGKLTDGKEAWAEFYEKTQRGEPASIQVAHYYTLDPDRTAPSTYEAYRQDYPALYIHELEYDGEQFVLRTESEVRVYEYLMKYTGYNHAVSNLQMNDYTHYVLTHSNTVTWEQLWNGLVSSIYGAYIDHYTICSEYH